MSRANKHRSNQINNISLSYMTEELGLKKACPRRSCSGTMTEVLARYRNYGPVNQEYECIICGKVIKDPRYKKERERRWQQKKKRWQKKSKKGNNKEGEKNETKS